MNRRKIILPLATAGIASILVVGAVAGQDPEDETHTEEQTPSIETRTGTIEAVTDADGDVDYLLTDENGTIKLSVGPPWFWGDAHPLNGVSGDVTVTGELDDGTPPAHANDNARDRADGEPSFDLFRLNGDEIRAAGKPPWAADQPWSASHIPATPAGRRARPPATAPEKTTELLSPTTREARPLRPGLSLS